MAKIAFRFCPDLFTMEVFKGEIDIVGDFHQQILNGRIEGIQLRGCKQKHSDDFVIFPQGQ